MHMYTNYWQKDQQYGDNFVESAMSRDPFLSIMRAWHFGESTEVINDWLSKVNFQNDHLNNTMMLPEDLYEVYLKIIYF